MKTYVTILCIFCWLFTTCGYKKYPNEIDQLSTPKEIETFVHQLKPNYKQFKVNHALKFAHINCSQLANALKIKPWIRADFDKNGYSDLLVHSQWGEMNYITSVMGYAEEQYKVKIMDTGINCDLAKPVETKAGSLIEKFHFGDTLYTKSWSYMVKLGRKINQAPKILPNTYRDTLTYQLGHWIEYTQSPATHQIQQIKFKVTDCLGSCPIFDITIQANGKAHYHAIKDHLRKGHFTSQLTPPHLEQIKALLNYIHFTQLKNVYPNQDIAQMTTELSIKYDQGKVKTIQNTTLGGTQGLAHLYQLLINLRKTQRWQPH
jgi:hypothetical protein